MKLKTILTLVTCLTALPLAAQVNPEVDLLKQQLQAVKEAFEKAQAESRRQIEELTKKIDGLSKHQNAASNEQQQLRRLMEAPVVPRTVTTLEKPWSASQPITLARAGSAYMNVSFDALMDLGWSTASDPSKQLQLGDHDPLQRGFSLRNAEIALDGAVDPYFKGFANIVFKLDKNNETELELEEVFLQSTSLPGDLQLKAGQFFAAFGRQNPQHPHQWAFVDQPLMLNRALGPEGLRNLGAQLSWLIPLPFYTEAFLGVFNGNSGQAFSFRNPGEDDGTGVNRFAGRATLGHGLRGPGDLLYVPRIASSFELNDSQTLLVGASGAFGPNDTGAHHRTEIYGVDLFWKWKPVNASEGYPFVSFQTEALYRRFEAGADPTASPGPLPAETLGDWGFYAQLMWGFKPHWVTGLRGEFVTGNKGAFDSMDVFRGDRTRISPVLTWYPSEFSKVRLQYNYDRGQFLGDQHSVWLQWEFQLGAHSAHKF